jgi:chromosome segregation ATPase
MLQFIESIGNIQTLSWIIFLAAGMAVGFLIGKTYKTKRLKRSLQHLERERNILHVKCTDLKERVEIQDLDIKKYSAELSNLTTLQAEYQEERVNMKIQMAQSAPMAAYRAKCATVESQELMINLLRTNVSRLTGEMDQLLIQKQSADQLFEYLTKVQNENRELKNQLNGPLLNQAS